MVPSHSTVLIDEKAPRTLLARGKFLEEFRSRAVGARSTSWTMDSSSSGSKEGKTAEASGLGAVVNQLLVELAQLRQEA